MDGNACAEFEDDGTDTDLGAYTLQQMSDYEMQIQEVTDDGYEALLLSNLNDDVEALFRHEPTSEDTTLSTLTTAMQLYKTFHKDLYDELHTLDPADNASSDTVVDFVAGYTSDLAV